MSAEAPPEERQAPSRAFHGATNPDEPYVSVIFPAHNEEENIAEELRQCARAVATTPWKWEFIVVDDGSTDSTVEVVSRIRLDGIDVRLLRQATNAGKTMALRTGVQAARGSIIAIMDADLQYDARDLVRAVELVHDGWDGVNGWRAHRQDDWGRRYPSLIFNWLIRLAFHLRIRDANSGLKAFRAEALRRIPLEGDAHRLLIPLVSAAGFRITEIPVRHYARPHGTSKYGVLRLVNGTVSVVGLRLIFALGWNPNGVIPRAWRFVHYRLWSKIDRSVKLRPAPRVPRLVGAHDEP